MEATIIKSLYKQEQWSLYIGASLWEPINCSFYIEELLYAGAVERLCRRLSMEASKLKLLYLGSSLCRNKEASIYEPL